MRSLEMGACETLIVWENLDLLRYVVKDPNEESEEILHVTPAQNKTKEFLKADDGMEKDVIESEPIVEWLVNNYKKFGTKLEIVTDRSEEGSQFVKGFGGVGGLLRYQVDFNEFHAVEEEIQEDWDYDDIF